METLAKPWTSSLRTKVLVPVIECGMIIGAVVYFAWYRPKSKRVNQVRGSETASARNAHEHVTR